MTASPKESNLTVRSFRHCIFRKVAWQSICPSLSISLDYWYDCHDLNCILPRSLCRVPLKIKGSIYYIWMSKKDLSLPSIQIPGHRVGDREMQSDLQRLLSLLPGLLHVPDRHLPALPVHLTAQ